jgi:DNA-binding CsgD family transcriptional regulator
MPSLVNARLWQDFYLGRYDQATADAHTIIELSDNLGTYVHKFDAWQLLSMMSALGGDFDQARKMLRNVERTDEADAGVRVPGVVLIKSYIIAAEGNPAEAIRLAKPMLNTASITRNYWPRSHEWSRFHAVMARQADDPEFAEQCVERAELASERNPGVASYQGLAVQVRGYVHRDPELIGTAVDILRHSPRPQLLAMALADHGEALLTTLRTDKAIDLLREAAVIMDRIGHHHHLTSINSTLQRAGVEPHQSKSGKSGTGWEALTHTERAVAKFIIQGQTNRAAAAHLGISINTVGTHLRAIFAKVGVHSRVQLTNAWNNQ